MPLFQVSGSRAAGDRDYDVETIIHATEPRFAAMHFYRDWADLGWRPGIIVVQDLEGGVPCLFELRGNLLLEAE